jgi:tryptophan-rich sensory protein
MDKENSFLRKPFASYNRDITLRLAISIAIPLMAGVIGSIFTSQSVSTWFQTIERPWFSPPNWLFGPVWTTLYVLMGISLFLVWRATSTITLPKDRHSRKIAAFIVFGIQLILNVLWSFLFFGLRSPQLAFAEIVILLISIVVTIVIFSKISRLAALLMMPYTGWVTFASFLNLQIWLLNPS